MQKYFIFLIVLSLFSNTITISQDESNFQEPNAVEVTGLLGNLIESEIPLYIGLIFIFVIFLLKKGKNIAIKKQRELNDSYK